MCRSIILTCSHVKTVLIIAQPWTCQGFLDLNVTFFPIYGFLFFCQIIGWSCMKFKNSQRIPRNWDQGLWNIWRKMQIVLVEILVPGRDILISIMKIRMWIFHVDSLRNFQSVFQVISAVFNLFFSCFLYLLLDA